MITLKSIPKSTGKTAGRSIWAIWTSRTNLDLGGQLDLGGGLDLTEGFDVDDLGIDSGSYDLGGYDDFGGYDGAVGVDAGDFGGGYFGDDDYGDFGGFDDFDF